MIGIMDNYSCTEKIRINNLNLIVADLFWGFWISGSGKGFCTDSVGQVFCCPLVQFMPFENMTATDVSEIGLER